MSDPFTGQIALFGFGFAPYGWAPCAGQILPIAANTALFSLLGTTYGGNGTSNFGLPNLQGIVALGQSSAPGLTPYALGETGGEETHALSGSEGTIHTHTLMARTVPATSAAAAGNVLAIPQSSDRPRAALGKIYNSNAANVKLTSTVTATSGVGQPHVNRQPTLALNYCICLQGIFPQRG